MVLELYLIGVVLSFAAFLYDVCKLYRGIRLDVAIVVSVILGIAWPFTMALLVARFLARRFSDVWNT